MESNRLSPEHRMELVEPTPREDIARLHERASGSAKEHLETSHVGVPSMSFSAPVLPPPTATAVSASNNSIDDAVIASDLPVAANDDDLIEKEWVDKVKSVIAQTKDDPYRREKEVTRVQADYLKKRYGKDLGVVAQDS